MMLMITGCQTIKDKTDAIVEKENEKLSKYISKPASVLQTELGKPDEDFKNAKGNFELIYNILRRQRLVHDTPVPPIC